MSDVTRFALPLSLCFAACTTSPDTDTQPDTGNPDTGPGSSGPDTGTAFLTWHGTLSYNADNETLTATRGIGARTLEGEGYVCDIVAEYVGTGAGARGCPDCEYSFSTELTEGRLRGDHCRSFSQPTMFDYYDYGDFYFGTNLDGFGWSESYTYTYASVEYALTDIVWGHVSGSRYDGWYLYGYNFPASSSYNVVGDKYEASFSRPVVGQTGSLTYYYFYY